MKIESSIKLTKKTNDSLDGMACEILRFNFYTLIGGLTICVSRYFTFNYFTFVNIFNWLNVCVQSVLALFSFSFLKSKAHWPQAVNDFVATAVAVVVLEKVFPTKTNEMDVAQLIGCVMGYNIRVRCRKNRIIPCFNENYEQGLQFVVMPKKPTETMPTSNSIAKWQFASHN